MEARKKLTKFRESREMSQYRLARELGTSSTTILRIEAGTQIPGLDVALRIAEYTGGSPAVEDWATARRSGVAKCKA